jgi:hypothetical protein
LTVTLEDKQHLTQVWTYEYNGKKGANTFQFTRSRQRIFFAGDPAVISLKGPFNQWVAGSSPAWLTTISCDYGQKKLPPFLFARWEQARICLLLSVPISTKIRATSPE